MKKNNCLLALLDIHPWMSWIKNEQASPGFPGGSDGKESACNAGDLGSIPESGRSSGEENGYPLQYSGLENSVDRGTWWAMAHRVTKSQPQPRINTSTFPWPWELWIPNFPWPQGSGPFFLSFLYISSTLLVMLSINEHFLWSWAARLLQPQLRTPAAAQTLSWIGTESAVVNYTGV